MRVRVWINGSDGPSYDFEMLDPPRIGELVTIAAAGETLQTLVESVDWHLQGIERSQDGLALDGEPMGSVTLVHVICRQATPSVLGAMTTAEADAFSGSVN